MNTTFNKHILSFFFCAFALIALSACGGGSSGGGGGGAAKADPCIADPTLCYVDRASYTASDDSDVAAADVRTLYALPATATIADAVTAIKAIPEYQASGSADQIGAAYAHARGYTGAGIIVSAMGRKFDRTTNELDNGKLIQGYRAYSRLSVGTGLATCTSSVSCQGIDQDTHLAAIIAGESDNANPDIATVADADLGSMQGIAYSAKIKPVDIITEISGDDLAMEFHDLITPDDFNLAIVAASGSTIAVMNNGWDKSTLGGRYQEYMYKTPVPLGTATIDADERAAWTTAVATTVVVFPQGDNGYNSENGMVKLYNADGTEAQELGTDGVTMVDKRVAWKDIRGGGGNLGTAHARLASTDANAHDAVKGSWLSVIALDSNNRIADFSNGCGDAKAYCLGAPGVNIISSITSNGNLDGITGMMSGTAQAAAHVSGAVAILAGAFPTMTPAELVSLILDTADDLGIEGVDDIYGHGIVNLARATDPIGSAMITDPNAAPIEAGITLDNSGITLPTSFGGALDGFTVGFIDDYKRAYIGNPARISRTNAAFTLGDTIATWESPELKNIQLDSNSKMQFTNYDENSGAKDTLIFTHNLPNHTIGFSYNEESKTPDLMLAGDKDDLHFQKIRPIASDLMQLNATHKLGSKLTVKNAITSGEFDTGNRFNEAMANLNYASENRNLTIGAGTLKEYGQFLGASGTGAYQLSDATQSRVTHLAITQNLPLNSAIKVKYTNFKTEVDMRYNNFAKINDLTADEYQLSLTKRKILGKNDSLNLELIQPFAVTDGTLQQSTVLGYNDQGDYNNVTQNYSLAPTKRRQQLRMTWQNQINLARKTRFFISMQYENHVDNLRDKEDSSILGGISTKF